MCRCLVARAVRFCFDCVSFALRAALSRSLRALFFSLFANTDCSNAQQEYFCRRRSQNAYWRRHGDLCRARFRQQRRRQCFGCIATGSSIQLNTLRVERVLIVDFNGKIKRILCLYVHYRVLFSSLALFLQIY